MKDKDYIETTIVLYGDFDIHNDSVKFEVVHPRLSR